jgi:hypothetical protein
MATNDDELRGCHEEIQRLTAENQELREAAKCFGDLAERLNRQLQVERRLRQREALTSQPSPDRGKKRSTLSLISLSKLSWK